MAQVQLGAVVRAERGKGAARRTRRSGFVPGVLYGAGRSSTALQVSAKDLELFLQRGATRLVALQLDGVESASEKEQTAIVKDVHLHPAKGDALHVDFQAVSMDQEVTTTVPVWLTGEEERANDGGIVTLSLREVEVACRADEIPESVNVDVSKLEAGENLTVADLVPQKGIRLVASPDEVVVSVLEKSRAEDAEETTDEAEVAEVGEGDQGAASDAS